MIYITIIFIIVVTILMAYSIHLVKEIKCQQFTLNNLNESLKTAKQDLDTLAQQRQSVYLEAQQLKEDSFEIKKDINFLNKTASELRNNLKEQKQQNEEELLHQKAQLKTSLDAYSQEVKTSMEQDFLTVQKDFVDQFKVENTKKLNAAKELSDKLKELKTSVDAATRIAKAELEKENYNQYHSLQISQENIQDINKIEAAVIDVSPIAKTAIAKVIWKVYYEKPYTDLVGRLLQAPTCGIYKITDMHNRCYVGQAVDIGERWKQHIKRAIGAEERTNNKLYPAMDKLGPWNFTFDVIEECPRNKLNEREDYWQEFYHAKDFGYSIK